VLPGAVAPTPEGTVASPQAKKRSVGGEMGAAAGPAIMPKAPSEDAIIGKILKLDGEASAIEFSRAGADLQVAKLTLMDCVAIRSLSQPAPSHSTFSTGRSSSPMRARPAN